MLIPDDAIKQASPSNWEKIFDDYLVFEGKYVWKPNVMREFIASILKPKTRTQQQNSALHLFFTQLAEELNEKGFDMRDIMSEVEISWTPYSVKEYLWKPLLKAMTGKDSTTKMDKAKEIDMIYDNLTRILAKRTKGWVEIPPFPSIDYNLKE